jgi:hypothetical protein
MSAAAEDAKSKKKFAGSNRQESAEVRDDLNSADKVRVRAAIKKTISMLASGGEVATLFGDVVSAARRVPRGERCLAAALGWSDCTGCGRSAGVSPARAADWRYTRR